MAVFNWVASNIKYDYEQYNKSVADRIAGIPLYLDERNKYMNLDDILTSKSGVCRHYAALMTGMLRSLGIPCKYAGGSVYTGKIIEGYSDYGWEGHAWVA